MPINITLTLFPWLELYFLLFPDEKYYIYFIYMARNIKFAYFSWLEIVHLRVFYGYKYEIYRLLIARNITLFVFYG